MHFLPAQITLHRSAHRSKPPHLTETIIRHEFTVGSKTCGFDKHDRCSEQVLKCCIRPLLGICEGSPDRT
jgi:hypothetical protein